MTAVWISGLPGAGKTTLVQRLRAEGRDAHDSDDPGMSAWYDVADGLPAQEIPHHLRTERWLAGHEWRIDVEAVRTVLAEAGQRTVFFAGAVANESEIWPLFRHHVFLTAPADTLRHRLLTRTGNGYGKNPAEMADVMRWHASAESDYRRRGAAVVDSTLPIGRVSEAVLGVVAACR